MNTLRAACEAIFGHHRPGALASRYGPRGLRLLLNIAVAALVLALPFTALAAPETPSSLASSDATSQGPVASIASTDGPPRAEMQARGFNATTLSVVTVTAEDAKPVQHYAIAGGDTLYGIAEKYGVTLDDLAYANGIDDESTVLHTGNDIVIPPGRGALYTVKDGDTVPAIAQKFKVDPAAIMSYNRLYFEQQQNFAPGKTIFVPGAAVPAMKRLTANRFIAPPGGDKLPAHTGRLSWPVNGVITQYFWWGHTGVDIAAPYGTPLRSSDDGIVVATGWVAVGGLRVCVQHGGGFKTCYYHTSAVYVSPGDVVKRGQIIAAIGLTGVTTGPHVHWEVWLNGVQVNGLDY